MINSNKNNINNPEEIIPSQKKLDLQDSQNDLEISTSQMSTIKNDLKLDNKKESSIKKKKILEAREETDKRGDIKEDNEKTLKKDFIKIEEDGSIIQPKRKRGRPKKDSLFSSFKKEKAQNIDLTALFSQKNKKIKVEGTVKLDLTLYLD